MSHRLLILGAGNCVRSQMAEGLLRQLGGSAFEVHGAGSKPSGSVIELAIEARRAIGTDISAHRSKSVSEFEGQHFGTVVTVCDSADELCPFFLALGEFTGAYGIPETPPGRAKKSSPPSAASATNSPLDYANSCLPNLANAMMRTVRKNLPASTMSTGARLSCRSATRTSDGQGKPVRSPPSQGTVFPVCYDPVNFTKASAR